LIDCEARFPTSSRTTVEHAVKKMSLGCSSWEFDEWDRVTCDIALICQPNHVMLSDPCVQHMYVRHEVVSMLVAKANIVSFCGPTMIDR
jgi:hypothetical protein